MVFLGAVGCGARSELDIPPVDSRDQSCADSGAGTGLVALASQLDAPSALVVVGGAVYWLTGNNSSHAGTLQRCGACGCGNAPETLVTGLDWNYDNGNDPAVSAQPVIAADSQNAYFSGADHVYACSLQGCASQPAILASVQSPGGIAVASGQVYWTNFNVEPSSVMRTNVDGSHQPSTLLSLSGGWELEGIVVRDGTMYFTSFGSILTCPVTGCTSATTFATATPAVYGLAADAATLYWANRYAATFGGTATIESCPLAGCGAPVVLADGLLDDDFRSIATDGVNIYWADTNTGTVSRCPVSGCNGTPTVLATGQAFADAIAVDATSVYWTTLGTPNFDKRDGAVMKLSPK